MAAQVHGLEAKPQQKGKVAIIGSGLVGRSWAMLFATSGHDVTLYDVSQAQLESALQDIDTQLSDLMKENLQRSPLTVTEVMSHINTVTSLSECVVDAAYIQECVPEDKELKREVWQKIDDVIQSPDVIMASSTSAIIPSLLSDHLQHKQRFMVAHPANPPFLNPMVELVPAPWTDPSAVDSASALMQSIGQVPIVLKKEIDGFVQARIQAAIIHVAWQLIEEDYVNPLDLETAMHEGLGMWYAFLGPFDSEHLNSNGFVDCCDKYGGMVERVQKTFPAPHPIEGPGVDVLAQALCQWTPVDRLGERCQWRNKRMAALLKLKQDLDEQDK